MSAKPIPLAHHLLNAYRTWFIENDEPRMHVVVRAANNPSPFIRTLISKEGNVVMNIHPRAVTDFICDEKGLSFKARFNGTVHHVFFELGAILEVVIPCGNHFINVSLFNPEQITKALNPIPQTSPGDSTPPSVSIPTLRVVK